MFAANAIQNISSGGGPSFGGTIYVFFVPYYGGISANVAFSSDGSISAYGTGYLTPSTITDTLTGDKWYSPITTGIGSSYWIRLTKTSGSDPYSPSLNTWISLASGTTIILSSSGAGTTNTSVLFVEISSNSLGTSIVASGTVTLKAELSNY